MGGGLRKGVPHKSGHNLLSLDHLRRSKNHSAPVNLADHVDTKIFHDCQSQIFMRKETRNVLKISYTRIRKCSVALNAGNDAIHLRVDEGRAQQQEDVGRAH